MSFVARIVICVGSFAQPETKTASTQLRVAIALAALTADKSTYFWSEIWSDDAGNVIDCPNSTRPVWGATFDTGCRRSRVCRPANFLARAAALPAVGPALAWHTALQP